MQNIEQLTQEKNMPIDRLCDAVNLSRSTYYWHQNNKGKAKEPHKNLPSNALNNSEKQGILDLLHNERFIDKTPYEIFNTLIDEDKYYCSPRTMYRLLAEQGETKDRRAQRNHSNAIKPELMANHPNEIWSWDITKLRSSQRLVYYYLYVILDIFSRYVVGWLIADCESKELARKLIQETALKQGIQRDQLTLHADNGPSMTSHTVAQLLDHLGITKTHNRPYTSNDNPFSESQFKTLKYCPEFPVKFESLAASEAFCRKFFDWYNKKHYHSGIAWLTPESVHYAQGEFILEKRYQTMMQAYINNPGRFNHKPPTLKEIPKAVYINPPQTILISTVQKEKIMA